MPNVTCRNCGQPNADIARVCRYCGTQLQPSPTATAPPSSSYVPPHSWQSGALPQQQHQSQPPLQPQSAPQYPAVSFRCPYCGTDAPPATGQRISTAGWIVFAVMILFCFPLFFIGLLMKEEYRQCSYCRANLP